MNGLTRRWRGVAARRRIAVLAGAAVAAGLLIAVVVAAGGGGRSGRDQSTPRLGATPPAGSATHTGPPDASVRLCVASPSRCGYPDASNTGVMAGARLKKSGCIRASADGQVIENIVISNCDISVTARNVVIRNVKMTTSDPAGWAIVVRGGASATIDHVDIAGLDQSNRSVEYSVLSQTDLPVTVSHSNLHNCQDCVQGEKVIVMGNYIHDMANRPGAHVDGVQCNSSCGITVTGNTILNQYEQTSAVALFTDFGTPSNSAVSGNLLAGGGYTVYGGGPDAADITISDNRFARLYHPAGGVYGIIDNFSDTNTWTGNIWDDTGAIALR